MSYSKVSRLVAAAVSSLAVLAVAGCGGDGRAIEAAHPDEPKATVTVTQPAVTLPPKTVTKEVTKEVTPQSCLKALELADQGFTLSGQALDLAGQAFKAINAFDVDEVKRITAKTQPVVDKISALAPDYVAAKEACRAGK